MERIGPVDSLSTGASYTAKQPLYLVTLCTAASLIDESLEDTLKLMFGGHLQGFLPFEKGGWHITIASIERWLGRPVNIQIKSEGE